MKAHVLIVGSLVSNGIAACTYDEADQLAKLASLHTSIAGSSLDETSREVTWTGKDGRKYALTYGGCDHLGHSITVTVPDGIPLTKPELLRFWQALADSYWWSGESAVLKRALDAQQLSSESTGKGVRYDVLGTDYTEMYLESRKDSDALVISVGWVRTF